MAEAEAAKAEADAAAAADPISIDFDSYTTNLNNTPGTYNSHHLTNIIDGDFPNKNKAPKDMRFTTKVDAFHPNKFGLYNICLLYTSDAADE